MAATGFALLFATRYGFEARWEGLEPGGWWALRRAAADWWTWALIAPAVLFLADRFPLRSDWPSGARAARGAALSPGASVPPGAAPAASLPSRVAALAVHVAGTLGVTLGKVGAEALIGHWIFGVDAAPAVASLYLQAVVYWAIVAYAHATAPWSGPRRGG